mgnify:CR=1 FL=1
MIKIEWKVENMSLEAEDMPLDIIFENEDFAIINKDAGINTHPTPGEDGRKGVRTSPSRPNSYLREPKYKAKGWDSNSPDEEYFNELIRVSKNQIIWGANHFISKIPYDSSCWVVWDKKNEGTDFADCELAWTSFKTAVRKFKWKWAGMLQQNMSNKQQRIHPTEKPIQLYQWLLKKYAKEGDLILDTHLGSASIAIACHREKFSLVGCELIEEYYLAGLKRLENEQMQTTLF